jgi:tRNA(Ile)-lysidine synthase
MTVRLADHLSAALAQLAPGAIVVAFSGGMDSSVLLHALAQLPQARACGLRALHVDHGLHAASGQWARQCREFAARLDIACDCVVAQVEASGSGIEAAARTARYRAFAEQLAGGDVLALAHHADDQAETVLLKLLRGAGPEGLAGMRPLRAFAGGSLWRPLLGVPRAVLREHAAAAGLLFVDDPSNRDLRLRRNFLRAEILPRLHQHWPQASTAIAHSAAWSAAAAAFIEDAAHAALARIADADDGTLRWRAWLELDDALRDPVLRLWLRRMELAEPTHVQLAELERQLREAGEHSPCVGWKGAEVRRYRERLYAMRPLRPLPHEWSADWDGGPLRLPDASLLRLEPLAADGATLQPPPRLGVGYRRGGERLKPAGSAHTRELRLLLQEAGVPPWMRPRLPLIRLEGELIAVADLFVSAAGRELFDRLGARIAWKPLAG